MRFFVEFVLNLSDNLFQYIFESYYSFNAAVLVGNDGEVKAVFLHASEHFIQAHIIGNEIDLMKDFA